MRLRQLKLTQAAAKGKTSARKPAGELVSVIPGATCEEDVQVSIVHGLENLAGYRVLITSRVRHKCWHCGRWPRGGDGCTEGLPDLVITHDQWPALMACLIEVKGSHTVLSPEQKELEAAGRMRVARSLEDALAIVTEFEMMTFGQTYGRRLTVTGGKRC